MRIILTHEQADFDALASLLGAHLLDETSIPVLPRRMNSNLQAFLTLYGAELPFIDPRDLPNEPIELVTLVDTQAMISLKGMGKKTRVQVVDHHPLRKGLPPGWKVTTEDLGATTTVFVEILRERDASLGVIPATLLLLGIYEDTGSLTYTRTTPRDLNAAAYLLERGARLDIATDFLNHPLSPQQQVLYDRLREAAETLSIHGQTIVLACGDAGEMREELSTIAHKMRDLLEPDALFLLIETRGGIQLIARSTSDDIDVADIAEQFEGGGHERASAALIKERSLESVKQELLELLPKYIRPSITVAQIMSRGPQLLSPHTPVEEAASRMQRYGYEGYPVVRDSQVIGLLTRRAVDRALSHKLNLNAASLMEAGSYTVQPGDSIDHLQRLMTESGWGQIPVVSPESGRIIGIVTRTDLLKILPRDQKKGQQNLAERLESALPAARLALLKAIARVAHGQRAALYIVGGFVRDLLLERPSLDFDLVVEGDAIELVRALSKQYGGRVTSHSRFGTAKWHIKAIRKSLAEALPKNGMATASGEAGSDGGRAGLRGRAIRPEDLPESVDFITARTEFYTYPSALPTVERGSIKLDLHRRDFTMNTLALRLDGHHYGELQDYWGGLNDLRQGRVRVLHSLSFVDDPTRILRAVRFEQRFGFEIGERTLQLLQEARPLLERVSGDRIRHEVDHILEEEKVCEMLARLEELDLLRAIHPDLQWDDWLRQKMASLDGMAEETLSGWEDLAPKAEVKKIPVRRRLAYALWLVRLPPAKARSVISRLKLQRVLAEEILAANDLWRDLPSLEKASPSQVVRRLEGVPPVALYSASLACEREELRQVIESYASRWRHITPTIDGHDLRARGVPSGPVYGRILGKLRDAWLDGEIGDAEQEAALLEALLKAEGLPTPGEGARGEG